MIVLCALFCTAALVPVQAWAQEAEAKSAGEELEDDALGDLLFEDQAIDRRDPESKGSGKGLAAKESEAESDNDLFLENTRWALDLSTRALIDTRDRDWRGLHAVGLDLHKVFSGEAGDWGTLVAQLYLTRVDRLRRRPYFFDDDHDWELVVRIFNFNLTALANGRFNIRVGHFDMPYGLEYTINTNGTIRQFLTVPNLGLKNDFGVTLNGVLDFCEYEFALSRGTWNEFYERNQPFILSGRIGSPRENNIILGLSGFYGEVAGPAAAGTQVRDLLSQQVAGRGTTQRWRAGLDFQYYWKQWGLIAESSYGRDGHEFQRSNRGQGKWNSLVELSWQATPIFQLYSQYRAFITRNPRGSSTDVTNLATGLRWTPALVKPRAETTWALSLQLNQALSTADHSPRPLTFILQFRVRL